MGRAEINQVVANLRYHHQRQSNLCDQLEALADSLPYSVDKQRCLTIARQIYPTVQQAQAFEEQTVFPILDELLDHGSEITSSLERLKFEHWEDESFAQELSESLRQYCLTNEMRDGEKLSYMLRGFFDGLRRHMAFEVEYLIPILETEVSRPSH